MSHTLADHVSRFETKRLKSSSVGAQDRFSFNDQKVLSLDLRGQDNTFVSTNNEGKWQKA